MSTTSIAEKIQKEINEEVSDPDLKKRIGDWLAADKEFNVWFLVTTKRSLDDDDLMSLLDGYRETQESAESAWRAFRADKLDPAALRAGLDDSLAKMNALMKK